MVEELQHQLENTKKKQRDEIQKLRKNNEQEERKLQEEIEELVRDVEESKEMIKVLLQSPIFVALPSRLEFIHCLDLMMLWE